MGVSCQTRFDTLLNGAITSIQTTATLDDAPAQTTGYGTFQRGAAAEEDVYWAGLAGLQLTGLLRGLSRTALTNTEVVGNQYAHVDNSAFEGTLLHYIVNNKADVDDNEAITGSWTFNTQLPTSSDTPGANAELTTKIYVDTADNLKGNLSGGNTWAGTQVFANDAARSTTNAAPVTATAFSNKQYVDDQIAAQADDQVDASLTDTTPGSLDQKITFNTHLSRTIITPAGDEDFRINTDAIQSTAGAANANQLIATDANGRLDRTFTALPMTALEAVTATNAVALLPNQVQWYSQLTEAAIALGDANARRRYAVRFTPTSTVDTFTDLNIRARIVGVGQNMTVRIETDVANAPSGTLADADATDTVTAAEMGGAFATELVTWAGNVSLVAGTTYWLVFSVPATDGAAYVELSVNSSHDENYVTYTRSTFDLDAGTWGNNVTNATPFFWGNTENVPFGVGVVHTDADWGARAWNFIGFARTTVAANAAVDVYYDIVPNQTSLISGRPYYLSASVGALTPTVPSTEFLYRVGRAISATNFKIELASKVHVVRADSDIVTPTLQVLTWFRPTRVATRVVSENTANYIVDNSSFGATSGTTTGYLGWASSDDNRAGADNSEHESENAAGESTSVAISNITDVGYQIGSIPATNTVCLARAEQ